MTVIPILKEDTPESRTAALADSVCGLITRAVHNLTEVSEATTEWFRRDSLDVEMIYHTGGDSIIFSASRRPTVPPVLPVIIGQVVHGCRQVFDYIEKNKRVTLAAFPDPWPPAPDPLHSLIQDLDNALKHDRLPVVCGAMLKGLIEFRDASGTLNR
ncbi:hypothetical protein SEA_LILAS_32 [Gordonia phage Lilas]|nr:hypothetical protein SEA_LILAS_32 [Gordonia phage Lilas]